MPGRRASSRVSKPKIQIVSDTHDHQALSLLSHAEVGGIQDILLNVVAQCLQHVENGGKRAAMVVGSKPPDVLRHKYFGLDLLDAPGKLMK